MTDEQDRTAAAEELAGWYFDKATERQRTAFQTAMEDVRGFAGNRWHRARERAHAEWQQHTEDARALFEETVEEILATGQVSEQTGDRWTELTARQTEAA